MPSTLGIVIAGLKIRDEEARIIALLNYGLKYKQVADCICRSDSTVRNAMSKLMGCLDMKNVRQLLLLAQQHHFTPTGFHQNTDLLTPDDRAFLKAHLPDTIHKL